VSFIEVEQEFLPRIPVEPDKGEAMAADASEAHVVHPFVLRLHRALDYSFLDFFYFFFKLFFFLFHLEIFFKRFSLLLLLLQFFFFHFFRELLGDVENKASFLLQHSWLNLRFFQKAAQLCEELLRRGCGIEAAEGHQEGEFGGDDARLVADQSFWGLVFSKRFREVAEGDGRLGKGVRDGSFQQGLLFTK